MDFRLRVVDATTQACFYPDIQQHRFLTPQDQNQNQNLILGLTTPHVILLTTHLDMRSDHDRWSSL